MISNIIILLICSMFTSARVHKSMRHENYQYNLENGDLVHIASLKTPQNIPKASVSAVFPILYQKGGKVLNSSVKVYPIFYGNWTTAESEIVNHFLLNIGASEWYKTNMKYYQIISNEKSFIKSDVTLGSFVFDQNYSFGYHLKSSWDVVQFHLDTKNLPLDPNGVYFVLSSADVIIQGFCNQFCGWHQFNMYEGKSIYHGFIGVPPCKGCSANDMKSSPNDMPAIDALIDTLAHEVVEAISDPQLSAWKDLRGAENADKCNWHYGNTLLTENGARYNIILDGRKYLIQQNWDPETQSCAGGF